FENTNYATAIKNTYLKSLTTRSNSVLLNNYFAVSHPSEPNYVATLYGSTAGITDDNLHDVSGTNLVDLLEAKGVSWKGYMQDYPGSCYTGLQSGLYVRKHNPFICMSDISTNPTRCAKIVNANQLDTDLASNSMPQFSYYVPNLDNDGHDTSLTYAMNWFQPWFESRLTNANFTTGTLFMIIFDESASGSNQVFASLLGTPVQSGTHTDSTSLTHYSIIKTLENNWNLGTLGRNDATANTFTTYL
ncbi:4656_t:CDS:2, partial [Ambispora leptoticha]